MRNFNQIKLSISNLLKIDKPAVITDVIFPVCRYFFIDGVKSLLVIIILTFIFYFSAFHGLRQEVTVYGPGKLHHRKLIQEKQFLLQWQISMSVWYQEAGNAADELSLLNQGKRFLWRGFGYIWKWEVEEEEPFVE